jgi:hypothetical protein
VADVVSDSVGEPHAKPAGAAIAVPMPSATANAPTRPMCLPCPDLMHVMATAPFVASRQDAVRYTAKWYLLRKLFCSAQAGCSGSIDPASNLSKFNEAVNSTAQGYEFAVM